LREFFREHNRAITLVSVAAIVLHVSGRIDLAKGVLIGGLLPVVYLDLLRRQLSLAVSSATVPGVRGKLFVYFLTRYGLVAAGLTLAYWFSWNAFFAAVISMVLMYIGQIVMMGLTVAGNGAPGQSGEVKTQNITMNAQDEDGRVE
jgi:hypothetical protein